MRVLDLGGGFYFLVGVSCVFGFGYFVFGMRGCKVVFFGIYCKDGVELSACLWYL